MSSWCVATMHAVSVALGRGVARGMYNLSLAGTDVLLHLCD